MVSSTEKLPLGNSLTGDGAIVRHAKDLGVLLREQRKRVALTQADIAGLGNTGNRFIVELENGKPTLQLQKVLDVIALLGLEVIVRPKTPRAI